MQARLFRLLACVSLLAGAVWAQSFLGTISGNVQDSSGAVVPKAKVVLTETRTAIQRTTTTNTAGDYSFPNLVPGYYSVTISAPGFKEVKSDEMVLTGAQVRAFDARLEVGAATETIEVAAAAPTLNTENAEIAGLQSRAELINAPTNFRSTIGLFMMNSYNYQGEGSSYSLGGLRGTQTNFTIDGTSSNSNAFGGQSGPNTEVSFESVRDMKFMVSNNSAEFSNVSTLFIETRGGENTVHGSAFYNQVNGLFIARSFFQSTRPEGRPTQHQFGGSFGGPIWIPKVYNGHNKTFFYFAFEQNRFPAGNAFATATVPTDAFRSGDFSSLLPSTIIYDPTTGLPFPGNKIDSGRISPVSQKVQQFFFPPATSTAGGYVNDWSGNLPVSDYTNRFSGRIDHQFSEHDSLSGRFTARNDPEPFQADNGTGTTGRFQYRRNINTYLSETHLFSPTLLNEFRVGFTRDHSSLQGEHIGSVLLQQFGIQGVTPNTVHGVPEFDFSNFDSIGEFPDYEWTAQALEILDNVTFQKGRHNFKAGVNVRHNNPNIASVSNAFGGADFGQFNFDGSMTTQPETGSGGFDYADFLLGIPANTQRNFRAPNAYFRWNNVGLYLVDDFKISPKLTLNLGIRWEWNQSPYEKNNIIYTFDPAIDGVVVPNSQVLKFTLPSYPSSIPIQTAAQAGFPSPGVTRTRWHDFAPRVSFAYLPFAGSSFVIRGGYGIYYSPIVGTFAGSGVLTGGPFGSDEFFSNQIVNGAPLFQFPYAFGGVGGVPTQSVDSLDPNLRTPYVQQWNITAERELPGKFVARATYRGFRGDQIAWYKDLNFPPPTTDPSQEYAYFPYSNFYRADVTYNGAIQKLNAMDLSVERKYTSGFTLQSQFTLAKNESDAGNDGERNGIENPYNRARDLADVGFMPRARWSTSALYDLPFGRGKRFASNLNRIANGLAGGWSLSGILVEQTGQFIDVGYSGKDILYAHGTRSGRPDCVGDPNVSNPTVQAYWNVAAFALPAVGTYGNCPRNFLTGPGINNVNLGLQKHFHLTEKAILQFQGTATNAFNHPLFRNPGATITSGSFGVITGVLGQTSNRTSVGGAGYRMIEFGARIDF